MPKFAANLAMLFTELPFPERFAAATAAGFEGVEIPFPYAWEAPRLAALLDVNRLSLVQQTLPAGDWQAGDRGIACDPGRVAEFRAGVARAITYAIALGHPRLTCLAGIPPRGVFADQARRTLIANLRFAAAELHEAGLELLLQPLNTQDLPGFLVGSTQQAIAIMDAVAAANLRLQLDVSHSRRMGESLMRAVEWRLERIGHLQVTHGPARHVPGADGINHPYLFRRLDELGYGGWVGCAQAPEDATGAEVAWLPPGRRGQASPSPREQAEKGLGA